METMTSDLVFPESNAGLLLFRSRLSGPLVRVSALFAVFWRIIIGHVGIRLRDAGWSVNFYDPPILPCAKQISICLDFNFLFKKVLCVEPQHFIPP